MSAADQSMKPLKIMMELDMTKSDKIEHLCTMVRANADHCRSSHMDESYGYLTQLRKAVDEGGYATDETYEIMGLQRAEAEFTMIANEIGELKNRLIQNSQQRAA